jgi:hypothetical protein
VVAASYVLEERVRALKAARKDDLSYTAKSREVRINANGQGPSPRLHVHVQR